MHDPRSLQRARRASGKAAPEWIEVRLDALVPAPREWDALVATGRPLLLTARRPDEGGLGGLAASARLERLATHLDRAAWLDLELRSFNEAATVIAEARSRRCGILASFHDFAGTPSVRKLRRLARAAADAGADIFKVATRADDAAALARLLEFMAGDSTIPRAAMGMGAFGRVSRLALAVAGSVLSYCHLGEPNAPGQWGVAEFRRRLDEIGPKRSDALRESRSGR